MAIVTKTVKTVVEKEEDITVCDRIGCGKHKPPMRRVSLTRTIDEENEHVEWQDDLCDPCYQSILKTIKAKVVRARKQSATT